MPYKAEVDRTLCVSTASCIAIAANSFELDAEGIATVKKPVGDSDAVLLEAAKSCQVDAITVYDEKGNKIWPK